MNMHLALYVLAVGVAGAVLVRWLRRGMLGVEDQRLQQLEQHERFEAIRTRSPFENQLKRARSGALEGVAARFSILRRLVLISIVVVWLIALVFPFLGDLPAALISIFVAATAVLVGIAARPFVENLISGIVISFSQPIRVGDTVLMDGNYGTVEDITLTHTRVKIWDWRRYIIPNARMLDKEFINYSIMDNYQWAYIEFWVSYEADMEHVRELALGAASSSEHFARFEPPRFWIMEMNKEGIKCWVAAWARSPADGWLLKNDIRTRLARSLREQGIKTHMYRHQWEESFPVREKSGG